MKKAPTMTKHDKPYQKGKNSPKIRRDLKGTTPKAPSAAGRGEKSEASTHFNEAAGRQREAARRYAREMSLEGREIGALPEVAAPERRERCRQSLRCFIEEYFKGPDKFYLPWSADHLVVLERTQTAIMKGGLFALAMPRGSGKTSICERAIIWAAVYGYRRFIVAVGDGEAAATEILDSVKTEIETNEKLAGDFPEVCYPVAKLERIVQRCRGQLYNGVPTRMEWGQSKIALATIAGSAASGVVITSVGITGRIRGMKTATADGSDIRPDLVLVDDPQNDESAASPEQNAKRLRVLRGAILGLAGPGKKISGIMPCTVIRPGDMADRILDPEQSPDWNGVRFKLMNAMPADKELWAKYAELWADGHRRRLGNSLATEFYQEHREAMDKGAAPAWPERYLPDQVSAIQYAMELYISNKETFAAEYQNEPLPEDLGEVENMKPDDILAKTNSRPRGEVPLNCERVVAFIDVQMNLLFYTVCAFAPDWSCSVIDYGSFPDQKRVYYTLKDAIRTYPDLYKGQSFDAGVLSALNALTTALLPLDWRREDGALLRIERCLVDSAWGRSTTAVHNFMRQSAFGAVTMPSRGMGMGPDKKPYSEYRRNAGDSIGEFWMIPNVRRKRTARVIEYDTNFVKSFLRARIAAPMGTPGGWDLFGDPRDPERHRMFAEQMTAEYCTPTAGRSRRVDVWSAYPHRDNHFFDCCVGCYVAASERGLKLDTLGVASGLAGIAASRSGRRHVDLPKF